MTLLQQTLTKLRPKNESLAERVHSDSLLHIYYDDWSNGLVPYVPRGSKPGFKVLISPNDQSEFARKLFHTKGRSRDTLEESISEFMREITQSLILYGGAAYELCEEVDDGEDDYVIRIPSKNGSKQKSKPLQKRYVLRSLYYNSVYVANDEVIQPFYTHDGQIEKIEKVSLNRVLLIKSPSWIEGGKGFNGILNTLEGFSLQNFSPLEFISRQNSEEANHFEYEKFRHFQETSILRATKSSGWRGRSLYSNKVSEFYTVLRFLRFKKSQTTLRNYILNQLNLFLLELPSLGLPKFEISIEGLPSINEIDSSIASLNEGNLGFDEIIKKFSL